MKVPFRLLLVLSSFVLFLTYPSMAQQNKPLDQLWKQYKNAKVEGLPKSASEALKKIANIAEQEKDGPDYIQALILDVITDPIKADNQPISTYDALSKIDSAKWLSKVDKAFVVYLRIKLFATLANSLPELYSDKPIKISTTPPENITLWDIAELAKATSIELQQLFDSIDTWKGVSTTRYEQFTELGEASEEIGHDLTYAVLLDLVRVFSSPEGTFYRMTYLTHPLYTVFSPEETTGNLKSLAQALTYSKDEQEHLQALYLRVILEAERAASNPALQVLYRRLRASVGGYLEPEEELLFIERLISQYGKALKQSQIQLILQADKAEILFRCDRLTEAKAVCDSFIVEGVKNNATQRLRKIRENILEPYLSLHFEKETFWSGSPISLRLRYKQANEVTVRFYDVSSQYVEMLKANLMQDRMLSKLDSQKREPIKTHNIMLPSTADFRQQDTTITFPSLPLGAYIVEAESKGALNENDYKGLIFSTNLSPLTIAQENESELLLLSASSGKPVANATLSLYNAKSKEMEEEVLTDKDGKAKIPHKEGGYLQLYVFDLANGDYFLQPFPFSSGPSSEPREAEKSVELFTDRAIYRPGQHLYFKGIAYQSIPGQKSAILADKRVTLKLHSNTTDEKWEVGTFTTNKEGSFEGHWVLPKALLGGNYFLLCLGEDDATLGTRNVSIEEYKRPTFEVTPFSEEKTYYYGDKIKPKALASFLSGAPVAHAAISYKLTAYPQFWHHYSGHRPFVLAEGSGKTDEKGTFTPPNLRLQFNESLSMRFKNEYGRLPDSSYVHYIYEVSVTSPSGETHRTEFYYYTGKRLLTLTSSIKPEELKEKLSSWEIKARDYEGREVENLAGTFEIYPQKSASKEEKPILRGNFASSQILSAKALKELPSGEYRLHLEIDSKEYQLERINKENFYFFSVKDKRPAVDTLLFAYGLETTYSEKEPIQIIVGSSGKDRDIYINMSGGGVVYPLRKLTLSNRQQIIEIPAPNGQNDLFLQLFTVGEGQLCKTTIQASRKIEVPKPFLKLEGLQERYRPGEEVTFSVILQDSIGKSYPAELALWMYDAALDKLHEYEMPHLFGRRPVARGIFFEEVGYSEPVFYFNFPTKHIEQYTYFYDSFPLCNAALAYGGYGDSDILYNIVPQAMETSSAKLSADAKEIQNLVTKASLPEEDERPEGLPRRDFRETAVWLPQIALSTDSTARISFILPEMLTGYKLKLFAHNQQAEDFSLESEIRVEKELSIMPNMPRFIREGDKSTIASTVVNRTGKQLQGTFAMELFAPLTGEPFHKEEVDISLPAEGSQSVVFAIPTQESASLIGFRLTAVAGEWNDAAEYLLPVFPIIKPIVEAVPITIYGGEEKEIDLSPLFNYGDKVARNRMMNITLNANPLWGALDVLPVVLKNDQDKDAISLALGLYVNAISQAIVRSNHEFRKLLEIRRSMPEAKKPSSQLLGQEEKRILSSEFGAFYGIALSESQSMNNLDKLLDTAALKALSDSQFKELSQLQNEDGGLAWMPGMPSNLRMTMMVLELLDELPEKALTMELKTLLSRATDYTYSECLRLYTESKARNNNVEDFIYCWGVELLKVLSAYDIEKLRTHDTMMSKVLNLLRKEVPRHSVATLAEIIPPFVKIGDKMAASKASKRLAEYIIPDGKLGLTVKGAFIRDAWYNGNIPLHCKATKALALFPSHKETIEKMKLWLLNQKRTSSWGTPLASAFALQCLLGERSNLMNYNGNATLTLDDGRSFVTATELTSTTGGAPTVDTVVHIEQGKPSPKTAIVAKEGEGVAWGAVYATFTLPASNLKAVGNDELAITRRIFVIRRNSEGQERLIPLEKNLEPLKVGDKLTVELTITSSREYDFLTLRDTKPAAIEFEERQSGFRYSDRLGYYLEPRDSEMRIYIGHLSKGSYHFNYNAVVDRYGSYFGGFAEIQATYAPEFTAHSAGDIRLEIEKAP